MLAGLRYIESFECVKFDPRVWQMIVADIDFKVTFYKTDDVVVHN